MIIPTLRRNHGRNPNYQSCTCNHHRQAYQHIGVADFVCPGVLDNVGARVDKSCDTGYIRSIQFPTGKHQGEK